MQKQYLFSSAKLGFNQFEFNTSVFVTGNPSAEQPFGAIGGMPSMCEHLGIKLTIGRINTDYSLSSIQNSHILVTADIKPLHFTHANVVPTQALHQALEYLASPTVGRADMHARLQSYQNSYTRVAASYAKPTTWMPTSPTGRYGPVQYNTLYALHAEQHSAHAFDLALEDELGAETAVSPLAGLATLCIEQVPAGSFRWCDEADGEAVLTFLRDSWGDRIKEAESHVAKCVPGTAWLLKERIEGWKGKQAGSMDYLTDKTAHLANLLYTASEPVESFNAPMAILHMTTVLGHPGSKGAGRAAIQRACSLADAVNMPLLIESVPWDGLPMYYAQFGFKLINYGPKACDKAKLTRQGFVCMLRMPVEPSEEEPDAAKAKMDALVHSAPKEGWPEYTGKQTMPKLKQLHLSSAVTAHLHPLLAWTNKSKTQAVSTPASWAKEVYRQCKSGELPWPVAYNEEAEKEELEAQENARAARALQQAAAAAAAPAPAPAPCVQRRRRRSVSTTDSDDDEQDGEDGEDPDEEASTGSAKRLKEAGTQTDAVSFVFNNCTFTGPVYFGYGKPAS